MLQCSDLFSFQNDFPPSLFLRIDIREDVCIFVLKCFVSRILYRCSFFLIFQKYSPEHKITVMTYVKMFVFLC